ncbi:hypothetical protein M758_8G012000 [Ceratodon purpureus]|uniref:Uncharacterized protein n=1 Tax=Ceratodon purpureus TaxID=3225 RepID=A0A8T0GYL2_CERPU|nr:hypothetical protein KC19_8G012600 [Ceratodon purpureus]KAG0607237.1 hypothetical protein M758_8G012000 [Ceratodon purpureus]
MAELGLPFIRCISWRRFGSQYDDFLPVSHFHIGVHVSTSSAHVTSRQSVIRRSFNSNFPSTKLASTTHNTLGQLA